MEKLEETLRYLQELQERTKQEQGYVARMEYIEALKNLVDDKPNCLLDLLPHLTSMPNEVVEYIAKQPQESMKMKGRLIKAIIKNVDNYQEYKNHQTRSFTQTVFRSLFQMRKGLTSIIKAYAKMGLWMDKKSQQEMLHRLSNDHLQQILKSYLDGNNRIELIWKLQVFLLNTENAEEAIRKYYKKTGKLHYQAQRVASAKGWNLTCFAKQNTL